MIIAGVLLLMVVMFAPLNANAAKVTVKNDTGMEVNVIFYIWATKAYQHKITVAANGTGSEEEVWHALHDRIYVSQDSTWANPYHTRYYAVDTDSCTDDVPLLKYAANVHLYEEDISNHPYGVHVTAKWIKCNITYK